jgi:uncharacterized protein (TIRG00374 family)
MTSNSPWWAGGKRKTLIVTALIIALSYAAAATLTDAGRLADALRQLAWLGCAAILGLSLVNYLLRFIRWQTYLARLGRKLPLLRHLLYYVGGFAFTISPGKTGEAVRSLYLHAHGVTYAESIATLFVERLLDMFAIVILASLIALDHPTYRFLFVASLILVVAVIACVSQSSLPRLIERLSGAGSGRVARLVRGFASLLRSSRVLLQPVPLGIGILLGLVAWGAEGLGFGILCRGLHIGGSYWLFCGIYAVSVLAGGAAFFLPAGIGGMEFVMTTLLVEQGAELRVAIVATLLCRLATLWFAVLLGIGAASAVEFSDHSLQAEAVP